MKKYLLSSAFVCILSASSYVVGGTTSFGPPKCDGVWCTVNVASGVETFCCPQGSVCPNPNGTDTECVAESD